DFGTGVVKITPAHDPNDFEVGKRHNLPIINVMTPDAKITEDYPAYAGMDRFEARKAIVKDLDEQGYLIKVEDYAHNVGTCYRCGTTVEPRVSLQWFVKMEPLAKPAIDAVRNGDIKFVPERFEKNYFHWMENIRDWCISRQLWWGHRIPAFYCDDCDEIVVTKEGKATCPKCGKEMRQDPDTLDTWFSSALWPFSTLGWPNITEDLKYFYPTNTLVTGYDIITFWVSRMIFSGLEYMGEKPFDTVLIHGLVRDAQGRKMSKSLGNGIDPLLIIEKYGADALRFALASGNSPGNDMRFSDEKIESARNFANKLWNAARFVMMNLDIEKVELPSIDKLGIQDKWILGKLNTLIKRVRDNLDAYELGIALSEIYDFIWDVFCDWYIELSKTTLSNKGTDANTVSQNVIVYVLENILKLLHPFMPFITEEIYTSLPHFENKDSIMITSYPVSINEYDFTEELEIMERVIETIKAIRQRRTEMNVPPSRKAKVFISSKYQDSFNENTFEFFKKLASASEVELVEDYKGENAVQIITHAATVYIPMAEMIDTEKEKARLNGELAKVNVEIERLVKKLSNAEFVNKAPEKVVEGEKAKLAKYESQKQGILDALASL
ncbi:MAG: valine--tRNA ligase, partial [Clostridia bacterium]|nr:valine--tRNA ligase [Clostridia bacterium]